ncbi:hypothetical protein DFH94DRAFT_288010 [Russula ochroleuca]|uniref:Adenosine kinase n=1 Tax=Russula ochroleuca TaxID=152965 RepID=A0A9P5JWS6_9AGAM|nr:hypothetical protein DFH94DRAFT_288010 [Russula ochroleuca]
MDTVCFQSLLPSTYFLPPNSVVYTGCMCDDELAQQLKPVYKREGGSVSRREQWTDGVCVVVITDHHRSLFATLRAAEYLTSLLLVVARLLDGAKFFYVEGYFLIHGLPSTLEVAKKASGAGRESEKDYRERRPCKNPPT